MTKTFTPFIGISDETPENQVAPVEIVEMGGSKSVLCYATYLAQAVPIPNDVLNIL